jgi:hypothetical protein
MLLRSLFILVLILTACNSSEEDQYSTAAQETGLRIVPVDTIGIELGDSDYVFGCIIDAEYLPGGRIALLDVRNRRISVFDHEGNYVQCFGSEGSGPGEFAEPIGLASLDDPGVVVSDYMHGKLVFFDPDFRFNREITGFVPYPPYGLENGAGGSVAGIQSHYYVEDDVPWFGRRLGLWSDSCEPDVIYESEYVVPEDGTIVLYFVCFCTDSRGRIYTADYSFEEYKITCYGLCGDTLFHIEEPYERSEKTEEELRTEHIPYRFSAGWDPDEIRAMTARWEPEPIRYAIRGIYCDHNDRIWVRTGRRESASPLFEVYDTTGTHLATVQTDFGPASNNWEFVFGDSTALAFDTNPDDYSKVFILRIEEE